MGIEIERKFLIVTDVWADKIDKKITQGYISESENLSIRIVVPTAALTLPIPERSRTVSIPSKIPL